jgi:hypothetical protein
VQAGTPAATPRYVTELDPGVRLRGFVPVEVLASQIAVERASPARGPEAPPVTSTATLGPADALTARMTLFGDTEA